MRIGDKTKPSFYKFREEFFTLVNEITGVQAEPGDNWTNVGNSELREQIIKSMTRRMEEEYSLEMVLQESIRDKEGSVEGVAVELYHVFSTMFLVEVINSKIRAGQGNIEI